MLDTIKPELKKEPKKLRGQDVSSWLETSPNTMPLAKAHALFYKGLKEVGGDESKIHVVCSKIQISFFVGGAMAAKCTPEGEGLAGEGWHIKPEVIATICTEFSEALFEAVVNSSWRMRHIFRLIPGRQVDIWQLISVNIIRQRSLDISTIKEKGWVPFVHARTVLQSCPSKTPNLGMSPLWNYFESYVTEANFGSQPCWSLNSFAQLRDHGSSKRDEKLFSLVPLWWWQYAVFGDVWGMHLKCPESTSRRTSGWRQRLLYYRRS